MEPILRTIQRVNWPTHSGSIRVQKSMSVPRLIPSPRPMATQDQGVESQAIHLGGWPQEVGSTMRIRSRDLIGVIP